MTDHPALHQIELIGQGIAIAPVADQLTIPDHGIDAPSQCFYVVFPMYTQQCLKIGTINGMISLCNNFKNQLATGDWLLIARRLASGLRVTAV